MMRLCHAKVCTNKSWAYKCSKGAFKKLTWGGTYRMKVCILKMVWLNLKRN